MRSVPVTVEGTGRTSAVRPLAARALVALLICGGVLAPSPAGASPAKAARSSTVWLCRPGQAHDPCIYPRGASAVSAKGVVSRQTTPAASASKFDCFYVYPTVSQETTQNSNLADQPTETAAAILQASRFSQVCRVWAPLYRQVTAPALLRPGGLTVAADTLAYDSLLSGWKDYLAHDNHGRPIIFIGHSQGSAILIRLLRQEIDPSSALRKRMVSALIMGGNVQVPIGKVVGGSFVHIPTCRSARQNSCVIAYSTFGTTPPPTSLFGRPGQGVSFQSGQTARSGQQVACVNPVTFSSDTGTLVPYFLSGTSRAPGATVVTPWVTFPGLYRATCMSTGGATWLQVTATTMTGDPRPLVTASLGPSWGYHLNDVNLALGNLVRDVAAEEAAHR